MMIIIIIEFTSTVIIGEVFDFVNNSFLYNICQVVLWIIGLLLCWMRSEIEEKIKKIIKKAANKASAIIRKVMKKIKKKISSKKK